MVPFEMPNVRVGLQVPPSWVPMFRVQTVSGRGRLSRRVGAESSELVPERVRVRGVYRPVFRCGIRFRDGGLDRLDHHDIDPRGFTGLFRRGEIEEPKDDDGDAQQHTDDHDRDDDALAPRVHPLVPRSSAGVAAAHVIVTLPVLVAHATYLLSTMMLLHITIFGQWYPEKNAGIQFCYS